MKIKNYLFAGLLWVAGCSPVMAWQQFYITNTIASQVVIAGFPTNPPANYGGTNTGTGSPLNVRLHQYAGFNFTGLVNSTNSGTIVFTLVRASSTNNPPVVTLPGAATTNCDYETTPSLTLTIPYSPGTNAPLTWMTNLDSWYAFPADYIGVYSITNTATNSVITGAVAGLKPFIPAVLVGGGT